MSNIITANQLAKAFKSAYNCLENNKQAVNNLNVFPVPDGDTGTNMSLTALFAVKEVEKGSYSTVYEVASACANGALMGARGNSGVILSQLIRGFAKGTTGKDALYIQDAAMAMKNAAEMAYKAVMKPTEGTILTVAREMAEFAESHYMEYASLESFLDDVLKHGKKSLEGTPELLKVLKDAGVVDAGGKGLICLMEGAIASLKGQDVALLEGSKEESVRGNEETVSSEIEFQYCTEFLIRIKDEKKDYQKYLIEKLVKLGDSLLVVGDEKVIKVHVHTNEPWNAMRYAASCGELKKIKIENMKDQAQDAFGILTDEDVKKSKMPKGPVYSKENVKYVLIAVSSGEGFAHILTDLGVTYLVEGGQTMNPSTKDFLEIINNTNGENYILFPNNKNIILAAEQACKMSKKNVFVVPSKTIPQCVSALLCYDPQEESEEMLAQMNEAIQAVKTGQLTFAVRETTISGMKIKKGDVIGLVGSEIKVCDEDIAPALKKLVKNMVDEDSEIITIYYGEDVSEEEAKAAEKTIEEEYPDVEVLLQRGAQPLYYYIVSVE